MGFTSSALSLRSPCLCGLRFYHEETFVLTQLARTTVSFLTPNKRKPSRRPARLKKASNATSEYTNDEASYGKTCGMTFTETKGTIFYRRRTPQSEIIETLALIAEGSRICSLSRVKGYKEDTIIDWLLAAAHHAEAIEEVLLQDYQLSRGQLDALWSYVGNKGGKKVS